MKAIILHSTGEPEVLTISQLAEPICQPNEVIIENYYVGVNYGDVIRRRRGWANMQPGDTFVPGFEGAGVIVEVGKDVHNFNCGDRVAFLTTQGGYVERIAINANQVFKLPDSVSLSLACASVCVGITAWHLLRIASLKAGDTVLIHGASGGVGMALLQFAKSLGIQTVGIVSNKEKAAFAYKAGATSVFIRNGDQNFSDYILSKTSGVGVDAIFDCVGQDVMQGNLRSLRKEGQWLYYGSSSGHANAARQDVE